MSDCVTGQEARVSDQNLTSTPPSRCYRACEQEELLSNNILPAIQQKPVEMLKIPMPDV